MKDVWLFPKMVQECECLAQRIEKRGEGLRDGYGLIVSREESLRRRINSLCAERAAAAVYRLEWQTDLNGFNKPDVGKGTQVRVIEKATHSLIIRMREPLGWVYVLVLGRYPDSNHYRVIGSIPASRGRNVKWLRAPNNRPPQFFVPQSELDQA